MYAAVSQAGKLIPDAPSAWAACMSLLRGERVVVTVAKPKKVRSFRANNYWWGIVVPTFQDVWSIGREQVNLPSYDKDETHDVLVQVLVGYEDGPLPGTRVRKRTSTMSSEEFQRLIDAARELAEQKYGMFLPEPGERWSEDVTA